VGEPLLPNRSLLHHSPEPQERYASLRDGPPAHPCPRPPGITRPISEAAERPVESQNPNPALLPTPTKRTTPAPSKPSWRTTCHDHDTDRPRPDRQPMPRQATTHPPPQQQPSSASPNEPSPTSAAAAPDPTTSASAPPPSATSPTTSALGSPRQPRSGQVSWWTCRLRRLASICDRDLPETAGISAHAQGKMVTERVDTSRVRSHAPPECLGRVS